MGIWKFVSENTFDSPENQISLLISEAKKFSSKKLPLKILDVGGGLVDRSVQISKLGICTTLDIKPGKNVDLVGDAHKLNIKSNTYDVLCLFMVLEHLHDPIIALNECQRVLKPGGLLLATTVQYWHNHAHPNDYFRYTSDGLRHLCKLSNLKLLKIWSIGGPYLVIYHAIELNLPSILRKVFLLTCPIFDYLDKKIRGNEIVKDSVGWSLVAKKKN